MRAMRALLPILLFLLALNGSTAQAAFDDLTLSPRARAMGGTAVAVRGDAWSFYTNPSLLPWMESPDVAVATTRPNGADYNRLTGVGGSVPLPQRWGGVSLGLRHFGVEYKDVDLLAEYTISVSHGFQLFKDESTGAAAGWTLNFFNLDLGKSIGLSGDGSDGVDPGNAWTVGLDLGAVVQVWERTQVGFLARNINNPTIGDEDEELLQQVAVGMSYEPYEAVVTAFDIRSRPGEEFRVHAGAEFGVLEALDLRAGLETDPNKVTAGFGVHVRGITLDYAFSTGGGVLETTHQFGLSYRFSTTGEE